MSSTGRGGKRSLADFYGTPEWCVDRLLDVITFPAGKEWLEPGAGQGNIIKAVNKRYHGISWTAIDIQDRFKQDLENISPKPEVLITDKFLQPDSPLLHRQFDVVIGNPPYSLAKEFIDKSLEHADMVVFLLRLNYLGSEKRADFMHTHMPDVYVLPNRPSFTGDGTDSTEYAWFVWHKYRAVKGLDGHVKVLATTDKNIRKLSK